MYVIVVVMAEWVKWSGGGVDDDDALIRIGVWLTDWLVDWHPGNDQSRTPSVYERLV